MYAQMGMQMPDYSIQGVPQLQQRQGPLGALMDFGKGKALSYGLDMMFPGSGIAREAAGAVAPSFFAGGGMAGPLGGGMTESQLKEARSLGALSQAEYLKAMAHAGALKPQYKQGGGMMSSGMPADVGMKGPIVGMTPGPLGMKDMLAAGKGKDISKVTYKKTGGKVSQQVDIAYHAPLAAKPSA